MTSVATTTAFGPSWPAPLTPDSWSDDNIYTTSGGIPSAGKVTYTYNINNPTGYSSLAWGQGAPDAGMFEAPSALTYSGSTSASLDPTGQSAVWIGTTDNNRVAVELVATIVSGASGWTADNYSSAGGAPAEVAVINGTTFQVQLQILARDTTNSIQNGAWLPFDALFNYLEIDGELTTGIDQIDTDGEFVGALAPVSVATFVDDQINLDHTGGFDVSDAAANVSARFDALNADNNVISIALTDGAVNPLLLSVAQAFDDTLALGKISPSNYTIEVQDTAAHISAKLDELNSLGHLSDIVIADDGAISVDVAQISADAAAIDVLENEGDSSPKLAVADTAANISGDFDALNGNALLGSITLTDVGEPVLTLTAAQAISDTKALAAITNNSYEIEIDDKASNISADLDALNGLANLSKIVITDNSPITLTIAQKNGDAQAIADLNNQNGSTVTYAVRDAAANVSAVFDDLNAASDIASITLDDAGMPTLDLSVAQALGDTKALGEITNASYEIEIEDTAANISAKLDQLNALANLSEIVVADDMPITANYAQLHNGDGRVIGALSNEDSTPVTFNLVDSASDILNALSNIEANVAKLASITVNAGKLSVSVATFLAGKSVFDKVVGGVAIADTLANISANLMLLQADAVHINAITATPTAVPIVSAASYTKHAAALDELAGGFKVSDTAAAVAAIYDALNADTKIKSILIADSASLKLDAASAAADTSAFKLSKNASSAPVTIVVSDTAQNIVGHIDGLEAVAAHLAKIKSSNGVPTFDIDQFSADQQALNLIVGGFAVSDTSAKIIPALSALTADAAHITGITVTDGPPAVSIAELKGNFAALDLIAGGFSISDAPAAALGKLPALLSHLSFIDHVDLSAPVTGITAAEFAQYFTVFAKFNEPVEISDTAAQVDLDIGVLAQNAALISDIHIVSGTPTFSAKQVVNRSAALALLDTKYVVSDTGANLLSHLSSLETDAASILSITATTPLKATISDFDANQDALDLVTEGYQIADLGPAIAGDLAALQKDIGHIDAIHVLASLASMSFGASSNAPSFAESSSESVLTLSTGYHGDEIIRTDPVLEVSATDATTYADVLGKLKGSYILEVEATNATTTTANGSDLLIDDVPGDDAIQGAAASDIFTFGAGFGTAELKDFSLVATGATHATIQLVSSEFGTKFSGLTLTAIGSGANAAVEISHGGDVLTIDHMTIATLKADKADIVFV